MLNKLCVPYGTHEEQLLITSLIIVCFIILYVDVLKNLSFKFKLSSKNISLKITLKTPNIKLSLKKYHYIFIMVLIGQLIDQLFTIGILSKFQTDIPIFKTTLIFYLIYSILELLKRINYIPFPWRLKKLLTKIKKYTKKLK